MSAEEWLSDAGRIAVHRPGEWLSAYWRIAILRGKGGNRWFHIVGLGRTDEVTLAEMDGGNEGDLLYIYV